MIRRLAVLCLGPFLCSAGLSAQEPFNVAVQVDKLSSIFAQLYGPDGLIVDSLAALPSGDTHSAHFNSAFQTEFVQFGTALTRDFRFACPGWLIYTPQSRRAHEIVFVAPSSRSEGRHASPR